MAETDTDDGEIEHDRECRDCGATTYQFEACHECGYIPWGVA